MTGTSEAASDFDLVVYSGEINRQGYLQLSAECEKATSDNCTLILTTFGGDPHAGFRIARCLRHHFKKKLTVYVTDHCKSAGTLICIAGNELVIDDRGELGPLDVQVQKTNEILENSSGLEVSESLNFLQSRVEGDTRAMLLKLRQRTGLSTKMASVMTAEIVTGLFAAIYAQVDPLKIGELQRAIRIAFEYGQRLNEYTHNLRADALGSLVLGYPSHSFVIDRKEAGLLFHHVRHPNPIELKLRDMMRRAGWVDPAAAQIVQLFDGETVKKLTQPDGAASHDNPSVDADPSRQDRQSNQPEASEPRESDGSVAESRLGNRSDYSKGAAA
ncbi:MAG: SppA protein [Xanthomonadaceae bacterium]|nr:SppA protein [Xanthomonadaceae bacterium]